MVQSSLDWQTSLCCLLPRSIGRSIFVWFVAGFVVQFVAQFIAWFVALIGRSICCMIHRSNGHSICRSLCRSIGRSGVRYIVVQIVVWFFACLVAQMVVRFVTRLSFGCMNCRSICCMVRRSICRSLNGSRCRSIGLSIVIQFVAWYSANITGKASLLTGVWGALFKRLRCFAWRYREVLYLKLWEGRSERANWCGNGRKLWYRCRPWKGEAAFDVRDARCQWPCVPQVPFLWRVWITGVEDDNSDNACVDPQTAVV